MKVKHKTVEDKLSTTLEAVRELKGRKVNVGVLEGEHAWLAAIHEYGCTIPVTPKMRAFLHHKGLHLKATTTEIKIPERSFLRAGYDENIADVLKRTKVLEADVSEGTMTVEQFLKEVGLLLSSAIKDYATELKDPPNHSFTVEQKGSSNPLWDTGQMIRGITYEVE